MNYYIADMHLGHTNIIRLCNRPFNDVNEMNETLISNWNSRVTDEDTVYVIGDFAYKSAEDPVKILKQLKGRKVLIEGNHDKGNLKNSAFRAEFDEIRSMKSIIDNDRRIVLCHYPIVEWDGYFKGAYLVYGHIHNNIKNRAYKVMKDEKLALNAGVEITGYMPVTFDELVKCNITFNELNF